MWTLEIRLPSWLLTTVTSKKVPYCTCKPAHPRMKLIKKKLSRLINKFSRLLIEDAPCRVLGTRLCLVPSHPQHLACVATKLRVYKMADMEAKKHSSRISAQHYNTLFQLLYLWQSQHYRSWPCMYFKTFFKTISFFHLIFDIEWL